MVEVDVRIVVATNRNLKKLAEEKLFREDLYFRISAVLYDDSSFCAGDGNDVCSCLRDTFWRNSAGEFKKPGLELSKEAKERLLHYRWPGNVRELQNTMERAVILTDGLSITAEGLQHTRA